MRRLLLSACEQCVWSASASSAGVTRNAIATLSSAGVVSVLTSRLTARLDGDVKASLTSGACSSAGVEA